MKLLAKLDYNLILIVFLDKSGFNYARTAFFDTLATAFFCFKRAMGKLCILFTERVKMVPLNVITIFVRLAGTATYINKREDEVEMKLAYMKYKSMI